MENSEDYHTQIRMNLWDIFETDKLDDLKYCSHETCSKLTEFIIPQNIAGQKYYLGVCRHHRNIITAYADLVENQDNIILYDLTKWEPVHENGEPVTLIGVPIEDNPDSVNVWCKYCDKNHVHGKVDGHRTAHCTISPYSKYGYMIKVMENKCSLNDGDHQWEIINDDPPESKCRNCKLTVNAHFEK